MMTRNSERNLTFLIHLAFQVILTQKKKQKEEAYWNQLFVDGVLNDLSEKGEVGIRKLNNGARGVFSLSSYAHYRSFPLQTRKQH